MIPISILTRESQVSRKRVWHGFKSYYNVTGLKDSHFLVVKVAACQKADIQGTPVQTAWLVCLYSSVHLPGSTQGRGGMSEIMCRWCLKIWKQKALYTYKLCCHSILPQINSLFCGCWWVLRKHDGICAQTRLTALTPPQLPLGPHCHLWPLIFFNLSFLHWDCIECLLCAMHYGMSWRDRVESVWTLESWSHFKASGRRWHIIQSVCVQIEVTSGNRDQRWDIIPQEIPK